MNEFSFYHIVNERARKSRKQTERFVGEFVEQSIVNDHVQPKVRKYWFRKSVRFIVEGLVALATLVVGYWFMAIMTLIV